MSKYLRSNIVFLTMHKGGVVSIIDLIIIGTGQAVTITVEFSMIYFLKMVIHDE